MSGSHSIAFASSEGEKIKYEFSALQAFGPTWAHEGKASAWAV